MNFACTTKEKSESNSIEVRKYIRSKQCDRDGKNFESLKTGEI